jgi:hypothetical protein
MLALKRIPWKLRRAKAREWGERGNAAQRLARIERGPSFETQLWRAKQDARGQVLRHGVTYSTTNPDGKPWTILRSKAGRTNQVDLHVGSALVFTGSIRALERGMRRARL